MDGLGRVETVTRGQEMEVGTGVLELFRKGRRHKDVKYWREVGSGGSRSPIVFQTQTRSRNLNLRRRDRSENFNFGINLRSRRKVRMEVYERAQWELRH